MLRLRYEKSGCCGIIATGQLLLALLITEDIRMDRICAIISGGEYAPLEGISDCEYTIACDRGYEYALRAEVGVDLLLGDFDSYTGELPRGVKTLRLPVEKDDTDTMHAVRTALDMGYTHLRIYCALGGRLDHLYANVQTAAFAAAHGARVELIGADTHITVFANGTVSRVPRVGWSLSVFAVTDDARGVSIQNAKYTLDNVTLTNTFPIGASNEWQNGNAAEITVAEGILAVMECRL